MNKKICRGLILMTALVSMNACKKNDTAAETKTQLLAKSAWKVVASREQKYGGTWTDTYSSLSNCNKDNTLTFTTTGSFVSDEGDTKCNSADPQIIGTGTWQFTTNETKISLTYSGGNTSLDVIQLDANTLITSEQRTSSGYVYIYETTFRH